MKLLKFLIRAACWGACCMASIPAGAQGPGPNFEAFAEPYETQNVFAANVRLGHGLNILGSDPGWNKPSQSRILPTDFELIRSAGFNSVRFELIAFRHMDEADTLDPRWLQRLDMMLMAALKARLAVIIDEHDYNACAKDVDVCRRRLKAFWAQIAPRYRKAPNRVFFEILNEPGASITPEIWNDLFPEILQIIRKENRTRNVIVESQHASIRTLPALILPVDDQHIIASFHYYSPMKFTHQGASWCDCSETNVGWGTEAEIRQVVVDLDLAARWSDAHKRPIFLGEFGVFDPAEMPLRALWTSTVARAAEKRKFAWAYHQFDQEFHAFDKQRQEWVLPLLEALIPGGRD